MSHIRRITPHVDSHLDVYNEYISNITCIHVSILNPHVYSRFDVYNDYMSDMHTRIRLITHHEYSYYSHLNVYNKHITCTHLSD